MNWLVCLLLGTKRTSDDVRSESAFGEKRKLDFRAIKAAFDPTATSAVPFECASLSRYDAAS